MLKFDINVSELRNLGTDFDKGYSTYLSSLNGIYREVKKSDEMWVDGNAEGFIGLTLEDKRLVDTYSETVKNFSRGISNFVESLSNVFKQCGVGTARRIRYNGNTVNSLVSELSGVQGNLQQIHSILSNINWNLPYSFQYQYRQAIVNIINGCSRNQNTISDIKGLYSSVSRKFENSVSTLQSSCSSNAIDNLNLRPIKYMGGKTFSQSIAPLNLAEEALDNQNLVADITKADYVEIAPDITNGQASIYAASENAEYSEIAPDIANGQASIYVASENAEYSEIAPDITNGQASIYAASENAEYSEIAPDIANGQASIYVNNVDIDIEPLDIRMNTQHNSSVNIESTDINMTTPNFGIGGERAESIQVNQNSINTNNTTSFDFDKSGEGIEVTTSGIDVKGADFSNLDGKVPESAQVNQASIKNNTASNFDFDKSGAQVDINEININPHN